MNCGCNTCKDCESTPKVSGTEVTILSGTKPAKPARRNGGPSNGLYYVVGGAAAIAVAAYFITRK